MSYNRDNVFYKIIHKQIPSDFVWEGEHFIAIRDINPKAPVHILIIPKNEYVDIYDFAQNASSVEQMEMNEAIVRIVDLMKLKEGGFKIVVNSGAYSWNGIAGQEVPHLHLHVLGNCG